MSTLTREVGVGPLVVYTGRPRRRAWPRFTGIRGTRPRLREAWFAEVWLRGHYLGIAR